MWSVGGRIEMYTEFWWWGIINGRENLEDLIVNGS
jgi:hypothetical protein